ncbi:glycosyl hydrolase family 28-related protein [Roseateles chitinivorans]|uniref:glycosyl hydrolase family 28-related protein n=1 Tax=Roseateles chitinivorans TaxID=2917965 RepID=UPI003D6679B1
MPTLETPHRLRCALDFGIQPDRPHDVTREIQMALNRLDPDQELLFLPAGRYAINDDLDLPPGTGLVGSRNGLSVLKGSGPYSPAIGQAPGSGDANRIESLHLHNVLIQVDHERPFVIRHNVLRHTASSRPQMYIPSGGAHLIESNVLWREPGNSGAGIQLGLSPEVWWRRGVPGTIIIRGNLIGAVDTRDVRKYQHERSDAEELAEKVLGADWDARGLGHYRGAIATAEPIPATIEGNWMALSHDMREHPSLADFLSPRQLQLQRNLFLGEHGTVTFRSPVETQVRGNVFNGISVSFGSFDSAPTKLTQVEDNWFRGFPVRVVSAVNGAGAEHTTPDDLVFTKNLVTDPPRMPPVRLRVPHAASRDQEFQRRAGEIPLGLPNRHLG